MQPMRLQSLVTALLLASCGTVPVGSLIQLSRIDARTTDLAVLRVALRLPDGLRPRPRGVNMDVMVKVSGEPDQKVTFILNETRNPADRAGLPGGDQNGRPIYAFRLSPEDTERFKEVRDAAYAKRQGGKSVSIGMGVATKEFCRNGTVPAGPLLATTFLLTSETRAYITVTSDLDLRQEPSLAAEISRLEPC